MNLNENQLNKALEVLSGVGLVLTKEKEPTRLLELILKKALEITNADAGTIYSCVDKNKLKFEIVLNKTMNAHLGGTSEIPVDFDDLPLYDENKKPNNHMLAPWAAISGQTINIGNVYEETHFDLSGTKEFDKNTGYSSKSVLTVPMKNYLGDVIGVLQLINPLDKSTNDITSFTTIDEHLVESLASQAAVIITTHTLVERQNKLFNSLVYLINNIVNEESTSKDEYRHRLPVLCRMIANTNDAINKGALINEFMSADEVHELEVASWLDVNKKRKHG